MRQGREMKVSFVEPHLELFGGIRRIIELANRLQKRGHDVCIFHSDGSPCRWMKCEAKVKSSHEVLEEEHDVIIYNDPNPTDYRLAQKAKAKLKAFYVLELYEMDLLKGFHFKLYLPRYRRTFFVKESLRTPHVKLSNSSWLVRWLKEKLKIDSHLLIGGINTEVFYPVDMKEAGNEIRVLCSGDPRRRKGTAIIHEAVKLAKEREPRVVLDTFYGKGVSQEKMAEKYSSASLFVDAQLQAGWNNPVAEAMACKVPVICTDIGGVEDFAFHEKTALLVPPNDPDALATSILRLIKEKNLRETLRENAYRHIRQFDWDKTAERLEEILNSELSNPRPRKITLKSKSLNFILDVLREILNAVYDVVGLIKKSIRKKIKDKFS